MTKLGTTFALRTALGLTVIIGALGGVDVYQRQQADIASLNEREQRVVQQLALFVRLPLFDLDHELIEESVRVSLNDPEVLVVQIQTPKKIVLYLGKSPTNMEIARLTPENAPHYADAVVRQTDIAYEGRTLGTLEMVFSRKSIHKQIQRSLITTGSNLLFLLVFEVGLIMLLVRRKITRPLQQLVSGVSALIVHGDFSQDIAIRQRDEIGELADAFRMMKTTLGSIITHVKTAAAYVTEGSQQMRANAAAVSQGASEQATETGHASSAIAQMAANIQQNAEHARQTENIAIAAAKHASASGQAVAKTVTAMQEIAQKIRMIEEIAAQTKMLSLNATIEAVQAQEYGKGFAVVAAEVRNLAKESQAAAAEINALAGQSVAIAEQAGNMLALLVPEIQQTADLVREISAASKEQNAGADQINRTIQQLVQVTQHNAATSEAMAATAEELASQAEVLQQAMAFFTTGELGGIPVSEMQPLAQA